MQPQFQSSFIPKGPTASNAMPGVPVRKGRSILSFITTLIFALSVVAAVGVFAYKFYLEYSIKSMAVELETGKSNLEQETVGEIMRLNNRILATENLVDNHMVLSPLFTLLEVSTLRNVRFTEFDYTSSQNGSEVLLKGVARGYASLALQADLLNKNKNFQNPVFSDLALDEEGNVAFSFRANINSTLLSYTRMAGGNANPIQTTPALAPTGTTTPVNRTATTTPPATSTPRN